MSEKRITDEEYLVDLVPLSDIDQNGVCFSKFTLEDPGYLIDISSSSNEDVIENNETIYSYRKQPAMIPVTFFNVERNVKLLSECRPLSIILIDFKKYPKNELYSKTTSKSVYNLDTNARIIETAYQNLQALVKSPTNVINNNYMSQPDIDNTDVNDKSGIFSKQSNSIEEMVNSALDIVLEGSSSKTSLSHFENQNIESSILKEAQITKEYDQITDSGKKSKIAMKDNKKQVIENRNLNGRYSPILPCPLKQNNKTVQSTSNISTLLRQPHKYSDLICTKKIFSDKRVLPHYHEGTLSNHLNSAQIKNVSENKKKEYVPYTNLIRLLKRPIQTNTNIGNNENQRKRTHNHKQVPDFSTQSNSALSGYSPPILPIPTYEKTFEVLSKIQHNFFKSTNQGLNFFQTPAPNLTKRRKMIDNKEINNHQCI